MTDEVLDTAGVPPIFAPVPTTTAGKINEIAKTVVFWTIMFFGLVVPPVLGLAGLIMHG